MSTTTDMRPPKAIARLALPILKRLKAERAEYEEECREAYRQGFRPHYCPHGMNLWVDWDPICGPCEEGLTVYEQALAIANHQWTVFLRRMEWLAAAPDALPKELQDQLYKWAGENLTTAYAKPVSRLRGIRCEAA